MNKNQKGFVHIFILIILALIVVGGIGYYAYKNGQIKVIFTQNLPFSLPTPSLTPQLELPGYIGYNKEGKRFLLSFPPECEQTDRGENVSPFSRFQITCVTKSFKLIINPQEAGRGFEGYQPADIKTGELQVGEYEWKYKIWIDTNGIAFSSYELTDPQTQDYYLIGVSYKPYSKEAKNYFDQILSTFRFLD